MGAVWREGSSLWYRNCHQSMVAQQKWSWEVWIPRTHSPPAFYSLAKDSCWPHCLATNGQRSPLMLLQRSPSQGLEQAREGGKWVWRCKWKITSTRDLVGRKLPLFWERDPGIERPALFLLWILTTDVSFSHSNDEPHAEPGRTETWDDPESLTIFSEV